MKYLVLTVGLLLLNSLQAQTVANLDLKNGFRDISLGALKASLSIASEEPPRADGTQTVFLKRSDLTFNGMPLTYISCGLYQNQVYEITVFGSMANPDRQKVTGYTSYLKSLFGKPSFENAKGPGYMVSVWTGNSVKLEVVEEYLETRPWPSYHITMKISSRAADEQVKNSRITSVKDGF